MIQMKLPKMRIRTVSSTFGNVSVMKKLLNEKKNTQIDLRSVRVSLCVCFDFDVDGNIKGTGIESNDVP